MRAILTRRPSVRAAIALRGANAGHGTEQQQTNLEPQRRGNAQRTSPVHLACSEYTDGKAKVTAQILSSAISLEQAADGVNAVGDQIQARSRGVRIKSGLIVLIELHVL
jgi:hypothetical protein